MAGNDDNDWVDTGDGHFGPRTDRAGTTPKAVKPEPKPKPEKRDAPKPGERGDIPIGGC